ncbi:ribonuclease HII [Arsenicibacter rosenii]|uniref:Ribonuclease HII n=1 Tax=Arsenicibacter rosenii TaxID=1750698 RepID=A0A1S2VF17_9BACT|nr:ribonuclease HII [Arsenicibacter rosenii]OIN56885.1 ribonuclease HII [Arsenicibacter rosenii]
MLRAFYNENYIEAGLDEVGRGCLAGPVVAAAVILPKEYSHPVLNDSKQVSRAQRERLRLDIERDALAWAVAEVSNQEIDRINILKASFLAMHRALDTIMATADGVKPEHLLVDGNRFIPYPMIPHTCIVKGDATFMPIAAASILAKCYRDDLMERLGTLFPHYGWANNAGYPTPVHRKAIQEHGPCEWHRMSFRLI